MHMLICVTTWNIGNLDPMAKGGGWGAWHLGFFFGRIRYIILFNQIWEIFFYMFNLVHVYICGQCGRKTSDHINKAISKIYCHSGKNAIICN